MSDNSISISTFPVSGLRAIYQEGQDRKSYKVHAVMVSLVVKAPGQTEPKMTFITSKQLRTGNLGYAQDNFLGLVDDMGNSIEKDEQILK